MKKKKPKENWTKEVEAKQTKLIWQFYEQEKYPRFHLTWNLSRQGLE